MALAVAMENLRIPEEIWRKSLQEPFIAEYRSTHELGFCHFRKVYTVSKDKLPIEIKDSIIKKMKHTEFIIDEVMFLFRNEQSRIWDDSYWLCIGKTVQSTTNLSHFMFETGCSGPGFGLGETSKLFLADSLETLVNLLTDKQRLIIHNELEKRGESPPCGKSVFI